MSAPDVTDLSPPPQRKPQLASRERSRLAAEAAQLLCAASAAIAFGRTPHRPRLAKPLNVEDRSPKTPTRALHISSGQNVTTLASMARDGPRPAGACFLRG
jgi:hypothetical protein